MKIIRTKATVSINKTVIRKTINTIKQINLCLCCHLLQTNNVIQVNRFRKKTKCITY